MKPCGSSNFAGQALEPVWDESAFPVAIQCGQESPSLRAAKQHGFFWLMIGNGVGVLLAAMLLWPAMNHGITPLTYGRWIPVHLNLQLYGWTSIPLLGWLFLIYRVEEHVAPAWIRSAFWAWSMALIVGSTAWLAGETSGKIFLDWMGFGRRFLFLAMSWIWLLVAYAWWKDGRRHRDNPTPWIWITKGLGLLILLSVPGLLYWAAGPKVYPSVNPHSGGPTGASLLGSTLIVLLLLLLLPRSLSYRPAARTFWLSRVCWSVFVLQILLFFLMDRSHSSHHRIDQILGLGSLAVWIGLMPAYYRSFAWPAPAVPWQRVFLVWLSLLVLTGFLSFLPGVLERLKFTNGLVAHSHLAMAGFITAFNIFLLTTLSQKASSRQGGTGSDRVRRGDRVAFWIWNISTLGYVCLMWTAGWREGAQPGLIMSPDAGTRLIYTLRLLCGAAMFGTSWYWWKCSLNQPPLNPRSGRTLVASP